LKIYWYTPKGEIGKETMAEEEKERHRCLQKLLCLPIEVTGSENDER